MPLETSCIPLPKRMNMMYGKISGTPLHQENFIMSRSLHDPCHNRTLRVCEDETHTPEMGTWESSELPKLQSSIARVKTPRIGVFFISLKSFRSLDIENGLAWAISTCAAQVKASRKAGSQTGSLTPDH